MKNWNVLSVKIKIELEINQILINKSKFKPDIHATDHFIDPQSYYWNMGVYFKEKIWIL
jgi:hypothetical protein